MAQETLEELFKIEFPKPITLVELGELAEHLAQDYYMLHHSSEIIDRFHNFDEEKTVKQQSINKTGMLITSEERAQISLLGKIDLIEDETLITGMEHSRIPGWNTEMEYGVKNIELLREVKTKILNYFK